MNTDQMLSDIIDIIDTACWQARREFGHEDTGLEDDDGTEHEHHPSAIEAAGLVRAIILRGQK